MLVALILLYFYLLCVSLGVLIAKHIIPEDNTTTHIKIFAIGFAFVFVTLYLLYVL